jgi:hypothetical protein
LPPFTLPSGRVVEIVEPSYGDEVHIISTGLQNAEEFTYAKCEAMVPGLTREEVAELSRPDGRALLAEVNRIFAGRPEEKEIPFAKPSRRR